MRKIENQVEHVLEQNMIFEAPVAVEVIAGNEGIKVSYEDFDNVDNISGMLYRDEKQAAIAINSGHHSNRQRFSIAHELGHYFLHTGELFVDRIDRVNATRHFRNERSSLAVDRKEIEANTFAANLLMPKSFVHAEISKILEEKPSITGDELIDKMSVLFEVSSAAMTYRLENLGILVRQD